MISDTVVRAVSDDVLSDDELGAISGGRHGPRTGGSGACSHTSFSFLGYLEISVTTCTTAYAKT